MSPYNSDLLEYMRQMQPVAEQFGPTAEDKRQALAMTILGASAGLLGARKGQVWPALGQGLLGGVQMGQEYLRNTMQDRQRATLGAMNMQERQRAWDEKEAFRKAAMAARRPDGTIDYRMLQGSTLGLDPRFSLGLGPQVDDQRANEALANAQNQVQTAPYVPTPEPGQSAPPMSPAPRGPMGGAVDAAMVSQMAQFASLMRQADVLERAGLGARARQYREEARKYAPSPDAQLAAETARQGQNNPVGKVGVSDFTPQSMAAFEAHYKATGQKDYSLLVPFDRAAKTDIKIDNKPLTESQGNAAMYLGMMRGASQELASLGIVPNQISVALAKNEVPVIPAFIQNNMAGPDAQRYAQAAEQWTEAALRITTGATAPPEEVKRMARIYFPQPGDSPQRMAQKERMRAQAEQLVAIKASPSGAAQVGSAIGAETGDLTPAERQEYETLKKRFGK